MAANDTIIVNMILKTKATLLDNSKHSLTAPIISNRPMPLGLCLYNNIFTKTNAEERIAIIRLSKVRILAYFPKCCMLCE